MTLADQRYTVAREFCGYAKARWVARFCGRWIGQGALKSDAVMHCIAHADEMGEVCNYPECKCPVDMGANNACLKGLTA